MRLLFRVLLLLNVLAFGSIQLMGSGAVAEAHPAQREIAPDKITLLPHDTPLRHAGTEGAVATEVIAGSATTTAVPHSPLLCLEWSGFDAPSARLAAERLETLALGERLEARQDPPRHWVFIAPLGSRAEAERKLNELKKQGVRDLHVAHNNAISLGLFSGEEGADRRLAQLKKQGVASALKAPIDSPAASSFVIDRVEEATALRIAAWAEDFPRAQLRSEPCPATVVAAAAAR